MTLITELSQHWGGLHSSLPSPEVWVTRRDEGPRRTGQGSPGTLGCLCHHHAGGCWDQFSGWSGVPAHPGPSHPASSNIKHRLVSYRLTIFWSREQAQPEQIILLRNKENWAGEQALASRRRRSRDSSEAEPRGEPVCRVRRSRSPPGQAGARTVELLLPGAGAAGKESELSRLSRLEDYPSLVMGSLPCDRNKEPYQPERRLLRFRFLWLEIREWRRLASFNYCIMYNHKKRCDYILFHSLVKINYIHL